MDKEISLTQFKNIKFQILSSVDESRKGSIDKLIIDLIKTINAHCDLVTTSSCSGRVIVVSKDREDQKENCQWHYISHSEVVEREFMDSIKNQPGNLVVKFEPFILHVQCRTLNLAKSILTCALQSGYRNSGITLGKNGKIIIAVRCTSNLEVPIASNDGLLVDDKYLYFLCSQANQKMDKNKECILKFEKEITKVLSCDSN